MLIERLPRAAAGVEIIADAAAIPAKAKTNFLFLSFDSQDDALVSPWVAAPFLNTPSQF